MIQHTDNYLSRAKLPVKQFVVELRELVDSEPIVFNSTDDLAEFKLDSIGVFLATTAKKATVKLLNQHDNLDNRVFRASLTLLEQDQDNESIILGDFTVTSSKIDVDKNTTTVTMVDTMLVASQLKYSVGLIQYPITIKDLALKIAKQLGVACVNLTGYPNSEHVIKYDVWDKTNSSLRDVIEDIASSMGCTARISVIDNNDTLNFVRHSTEPVSSLSDDNLIKYQKGKSYGAINSVVLSRLPQNDNIVLSNENSINDIGVFEVKIVNNPILDKERQALIQPIFDELVSDSPYLVISEMTLTTEGYGFFECGDKITALGKVGVISSYSLTLNSGFREIIKCDIWDKPKTDYQKAGGIVKTIYNTEIETDKQKQRIDSVVSKVESVENTTNEQFTRVTQDLNSITQSVQSTGGNNLLYNSSFFQTVKGGNNLLKSTVNEWAMARYDRATGRLVTSDSFSALNRLIDIAPNTKYRCTTGLNDWVLFVREFKTDGTFLRQNGYYRDGGTYTSSNDTYKIGVFYGKNVNDSNISTQYSDRQYLLTSRRIRPNMQLESQSNNDSPTIWDIYGNGLCNVHSSSEAISNGSISGNVIILKGISLKQTVNVVDNISNTSDETTKYSFSVLVKKGYIGTATVRLTCGSDVWEETVDNGTSAFYKSVSFEGIVTKDRTLTVELSGSNDSDSTFSDPMLTKGDHKTNWEQANGEILNSNVNINDKGIIVKSSIHNGDYTAITPLEFSGYANIGGTSKRVFTLNKDQTRTVKLYAKDEISTPPIKIIGITSGDVTGWAFVKTNEEDRG